MPSRGSLTGVHALLGAIVGGLVVLIVLGEGGGWERSRTDSADGLPPTSSSSEASTSAFGTMVADFRRSLTPLPTATQTPRPWRSPTATPMPYRSPTPTPLPTQAMKGKSMACCEGT